MFRTLLSAFTRPFVSRAARPRPQPLSFRPSLESLEVRDVPTTNLLAQPVPQPVSVSPAPTTIHSELDFANLVFQGYDKPASGPLTPIGIARVLNENNTYVVTLSGTDLEPDQATGLPEDLISAFGGRDDYQADALNAIRRRSPRRLPAPPGP